MIIATRRRYGRRAEIESPLIADALRLPGRLAAGQCWELAIRASDAHAAGFEPIAGVCISYRDDTPRPGVWAHWTLLHADGRALEPSLRQFTGPTCVLVPVDTVCPWCGAQRRPADQLCHWPTRWSLGTDCRGQPFASRTDGRRFISAFRWRPVWRDRDFIDDPALELDASVITTPTTAATTEAA